MLIVADGVPVFQVPDCVLAKVVLVIEPIALVPVGKAGSEVTCVFCVPSV